MADWAKILGAARAVVAGTGAPERTRFLAGWPTSPTRRHVAAAALPVLAWLDAAVQSAPAGMLAALAREAVSYTHLTLPTILRV